MSQERRSGRGRPPAANPAPAGDTAPLGGNICLTPEQFEERLLNLAQTANNQAAAAIGNQSVAQAPTEPAPFAVDFTTSEGNKLNRASIAALPYKFDVESQSINTFNEILMNRCITSGQNNPSEDVFSIDINGEELRVQLG